jgi:hypothetical protein
MNLNLWKDLRLNIDEIVCVLAVKPNKSIFIQRSDFMFSQSNQEALERTLEKHESLYNKLDQSEGPGEVIKDILVNFYSVSSLEVDSMLESIKSINLSLLPEDLDDGGAKQFREKLGQHQSLKFILDNNIVSKNVESLYQPFMNTPCKAKALELFDKFIIYFRIMVPFKLVAISFNIGGPTANRSGECQAFQLLGKILDDAHQNYLPEREVMISPDKKAECRLF